MKLKRFEEPSLSLKEHRRGKLSRERTASFPRTIFVCLNFSDLPKQNSAVGESSSVVLGEDSSVDDFY